MIVDAVKLDSMTGSGLAGSNAVTREFIFVQSGEGRTLLPASCAAQVNKDGARNRQRLALVLGANLAQQTELEVSTPLICIICTPAELAAMQASGNVPAS